MPGALTGKASSSSVAILALLHHAPFVSTLTASMSAKSTKATSRANLTTAPFRASDTATARWPYNKS